MPFDGLFRTEIYDGPARFRAMRRRIIGWAAPSRGFTAETIRLLRRIRARLATPESWCQQYYRDDRGAVCLLTALRIARRGSDPNVRLAGKALLLMLARRFGHSTVEQLN